MPSTAAEPLHVAVGVIVRAGRVLLARRGSHQHQGGLWEFPGGKVAAGETVEQALARELGEELGIEVAPEQCAPLLEVCHDYSDRSVRLDVWWVRDFRGRERGLEGQPLAWVPVADLHRRDFPAANAPIVAAVQQQFSGDGPRGEEH